MNNRKHKIPVGSRLIAMVFCIMVVAPGKSLYAETITVAVASNFSNTIREIAELFHAESGHEVVFSFASTGTHYAQIMQGAPFDAFFAADEERPRLLEANEVGINGSRFTYALGRLALWSRSAVLADADGDVLRQADFNRLAIANPVTAPYGLATQQVLEGMSVLETLRPKLVIGTNIGQTFQYVDSGAAQLGFVAYSQVIERGIGSCWLVPESLHEPLVQQAIMLRESPAVREFIAFTQSEKGRAVIGAFGYTVPD